MSYSTVVIVGADVKLARTSPCYQLVAPTIQNRKGALFFLFWKHCFYSPSFLYINTDYSLSLLQENSRRCLLLAARTGFAANTFFSTFLAAKCSYSIQDGALNYYKRIPITTSPCIQVPSVEATPDPFCFSLETTFKYYFSLTIFITIG
jgi:hypothetical protein